MGSQRVGHDCSPWVGPGKPNLPLGLRGKAGGCARVTAGPKRPHLGVCPGPSIPLHGRQGSRGCIPGSFSPGKEQAAGVWETCLAPGWPQLRSRLPFGAIAPGRRAGAPPLWQLARSFPVTGPQPLSSLRRAGNWHRHSRMHSCGALDSFRR